MDENTSLINIGELSRPATVLIEKISDAVGGIFKPYQVVRVAKAEAQADRVRAEGQIEISDLHRRAFHRFLEEEGKKQKNIEDITAKALPQLEENSQPKDVEDDWLTNFFDRCRLISDDEMQSLWSRVLAGEANSPGTYSKRTVRFLSGLDKNEAELLTGLCRFVWNTSIYPIPLIINEWDQIYSSLGELNTLNVLEGIGLVQYEASGFTGTIKDSNETSLDYFGRRVTVVTHGDQLFKTGRVIFTKVGEELAPICKTRPIDGFYDYVLKKWLELGYSIKFSE